MAQETLTIRVPATTANLGSGFDTLGLAVRLYNRSTVSLGSTDGVELVSDMSESVRASATRMLEETVAPFFRETAAARRGVRVTIDSEIPIARGLGSSVTLRLGVLAALNELTGRPMNRQRLLDWVARLEGHPDNAAPALYGGFTVAGLVDGEVRCQRFPLPSESRLVALIPSIEISTAEARKLVPESYSKADTVHAVNRAALITACLANGDLEGMRGLFDDRLHQPYRQALVPQLNEVIRAGEGAGAIGGWLSGSGSTIVCITRRDPEATATAMQGVLPDSEVRILEPDNTGMTVE